MNTQTTPSQITTSQPTPTVPQPQLPTPQLPLDPSNPLVIILIITGLISALDEPIQAIANLLQQLDQLLKTLRDWLSQAPKDRNKPNP